MTSAAQALNQLHELLQLLQQHHRATEGELLTDRVSAHRDCPGGQVAVLTEKVAFS